MDVLNNKILFSHSSVYWKSKIKFPTRLESGGDFLWVANGHLLTVFTWPFLITCRDRREWTLCYLFLIETLIHSDQGPTLLTSFNIITFLLQTQPTEGVKASTHDFCRDTYLKSITTSIKKGCSLGKLFYPESYPFCMKKVKISKDFGCIWQ